MSVSIPDLCEELKRHVGRSERTDLGIIRREAFQRFAVAADNLNPVFFEADSAKAAGYPDVIAPRRRIRFHPPALPATSSHSCRWRDCASWAAARTWSFIHR